MIPLIHTNNNNTTMSKDVTHDDSSDESSWDAFVDQDTKPEAEPYWLKLECTKEDRAAVLKAIEDASIRAKPLDNDKMTLLSTQAKMYREAKERQRQLRMTPENIAKRNEYYNKPEVKERRKQYSADPEIKAKRLAQAKARRMMIKELIQQNPAKALNVAKKFNVTLLPRTYINGHASSKSPSKEPGVSKSSPKKEERTRTVKSK